MIARIAVASIALICLQCAAAAEDSSLIGKYSGAYEGYAPGKGRVVSVGMTIDITSAENGVVKGVATNHGTICRGEYPFEGNVEGDDIVLRSDSQRGRECGFPWRARIEGNKLSGKFGQGTLVVSK